MQAALDGSHTLVMSDSLTPDSRKKPDGVMHLQLHMAIGRELVSDPTAIPFLKLVTRSPFQVDHDPAHNGKMASYIGRWSTRTGLTGPWSMPVGMIVMFVQRGG